MDFVDVKEPAITTIGTTTDNTVVDETLDGIKSDAPNEEAPQQVNILDIPVTNENTALNVMVAFINLAQRRGVFNVQESAKIWECIQQFKKSSEKTN